MSEGRAQHNNELFIQGQLYIEQGIDVYVLGDVHIDSANAEFYNDGIAHIEGDFYKTSDADYIDSGIGQLIFRNSHVNINENQSIYGDFTEQNAIANLTIDNQSSTPVFSLASGNLEITNSLQVNGMIRTDAVSHNGDGSLYANELYISSTSPTAIQFADPSTSYIEGKLRQAISAGNEYTFPISIGNSQVEPFDLEFQTAPIGFNVLTYFQDYQQNQVTGITTVCDNTTHQISELTGRWVTEPSHDSGYMYDVNLLPSNDLMSKHEATENFVMQGGAPTENCPDSDVLSAEELTQLSYFDIGGVIVELAIELEKIWAQNDNNRIIVRWTTSSETDNMGFELERSTDGSTFQRMDWIPGQGNSDINTDYKYVDTNVKKDIVYYYRIKAIETSGRHQYSPTVSSSLKGSTNDVQVFPNPIRPNEQLSFVAITDGTVQLNIYDEYARQVFNQSLNTVQGEIIHIKIPQLAAGLHTFTMTDGTYTKRTKLIIAH